MTHKMNEARHRGNGGRASKADQLGGSINSQNSLGNGSAQGADLYRLFRISRFPLLYDAPGPDIGGFVFTMSHWDGLESYEYYSVNHISKSGTGWQSQRIYVPEWADISASILAEFCSAELL